MSIPDLDSLLARGFSPSSAALALDGWRRVAEAYAARIGPTEPASAWWIPGRLEILGKHTDYGGGRSLVCAVERGFQLLVTARQDRIIRLIDAVTGVEWRAMSGPDLEPASGEWFNYPLTTIRRLNRDFPGPHPGFEAVFFSSLPRSAGLSSSSALVMATALPFMTMAGLSDSDDWQRYLATPEQLAGYLGAIENGRSFEGLPADFGVGTQGGSQDHTAILLSRTNSVSCFRYLPVVHERSVILPDNLVFVIATSGVRASKTREIRTHYNRLASQVSELLRTWGEMGAGPATSLYQALSTYPETQHSLRQLLIKSGSETLLARLNQFLEECDLLVPAMMDSLVSGDHDLLGRSSERSQLLAENVLQNQIAETSWLTRQARELGALGSSAFGAGFGGSVWALVAGESADAFTAKWRSEYHNQFPQHRARSRFFITRPGPPAALLK